METKEILKGLSLFSGLDESAVDQLTAIAERKRFAKGATIYREGEEDDSIFVVATGAVRIEKIVGFDQRQTLGRPVGGDYFGEVSFVLGGEHSASAVATEDADIVQVRRTEFNKIAHRNPALAYQVVVRLAERLATRLKGMDEKFVDLVDYVYGRAKK